MCLGFIAVFIPFYTFVAPICENFGHNTHVRLSSATKLAGVSFVPQPARPQPRTQGWPVAHRRRGGGNAMLKVAVATRGLSILQAKRRGSCSLFLSRFRNILAPSQPRRLRPDCRSLFRWSLELDGEAEGRCCGTPSAADPGGNYAPLELAAARPAFLKCLQDRCDSEWGRSSGFKATGELRNPG